MNTKGLTQYYELISVLAWKNVVIRYKQAYLGLAWTILKPIMLTLIFTLVRSFIGIDTGSIPYPILTFAALTPWIFFQESASEGINSVTANTSLIKKIYFPREVFPITAVATKLVELAMNFIIIIALMIYYEIAPSIQVLWLPVMIFYTVIVALTISFFGAAVNVFYRDVSAALPVVLSLMMYASPVMYPMQLVKDKLLVNRAAGEWSETLYIIYNLNPLAGIIDGFQNSLLYGKGPDFEAIWPGLTVTLIALPICYAYFKRAEAYFADVI